MKRTNIYLTDKQYQKLNQISKEDDIKVAELVRRAIDEYLATCRHGLNHAGSK